MESLDKIKVTVIHNLYKRNKYVNESVKLNLRSLKESGINYQYILFNDNGDKNIFDDVSEFLNGGDIEYFYSDINYGMKMCSGGWVGAIPLIKGDYIHNIGQDDVYSYYFYKNVIKYANYKVIVQNGFKINENFTLNGLLVHPQFNLPYDIDPYQCFKFWFGVNEKNEITQTNNNFPAPGVVYHKSLHEEIGEPDLNNFRGAADFEYWARILFNKISCKMILEPTWYYRLSEYSAGNEIIDGKSNLEYWNNIYLNSIKEKYQKLIKIT